MTPLEALAAIGWSMGELARRTGHPEATVRSWKARGNWPPGVVAWLSEVAEAVSRHPYRSAA